MTNNHLATRTIREWLELIPFDRARKEAIENHKNIPLKGYINHKFDTLSEALSSAFSWSESPQERYGENKDYWVDVCSSIENMEQSVKLK